MTTFQNFLMSSKVYSAGDISEVLNIMEKSEDFTRIRKQKVHYYNIPASFDIETSSFYAYGDKTAIMYEWTLGLLGLVIIGRTWDEFSEVMDKITERLNTWENNRLVVYVHNLSYEFQFIRKRFTWLKVFALSTRKPIYAITESGIEFRCSYLLSGYSLAQLGARLPAEYALNKMVGDLDYSHIRHAKTPLTDAEIGYCVNDVKIVMVHIWEEMKKNGNIAKIPTTKTGYVRRFCKESCLGRSGEKGYKRIRYREVLKGLTLDPYEYKQLKRAFQGGFTHANPFYSGKTLNNVSSIDETSAYPVQIVARKFPMSKGELVKISSKAELDKNLKKYCCLFDVHITGLESRQYYDSYLSVSRCWGVKNAIINNGRIVSADEIYTTVTEQDYYIIRKMYSCQSFAVANFRRYKKGYLPTDFVKAVLSLYEKKTTLKGVKGSEVDYLLSKEMLNSCYGMMVTDIVRPEITYTDDWKESDPDLAEAIEKYNNSPSRFLFYPWGVWVTAYNRLSLFTGITEFGEDYVYSDTDSVKCLNYENHTAYVNYYNKKITSLCNRAMRFHGLPEELTRPKTVKGVEKPLGVWDFEGTYKRFKTLGAKRYMVEDEDGINITVSGLNKKVTVPYLMEKYGEKVFDHFSNDLYIPPEYTGKNTHTYIDEPRDGLITDYLGHTAEYHELSGVHLEGSDYSLSLSDEYVRYILGIQEEKI